MALRDRYERNTGHKPDAIPSGDRFIASGQQQSPGKRPGPPSPGGRKQPSKKTATPTSGIEPHGRSNPTPARSGEVATSGSNPAGGKGSRA